MKFWPFAKRDTKVKDKRAFAAAQAGRLVTDWMAMGTSIDAEIRGNLRLIRNRMRQLERDNDYMRSYLREVEINVVGRGIPFQAQIPLKRGSKPNEKLNKQIQDEWTKWTKADRCHAAGKLSFNEIERLAVRAAARDGEFIVRQIKQPFGDSKVPYGLEILESDQLDDFYNDLTPEGNEIRMGVELNEWKRPLNYYFYRYHPGDYPFMGMKTNEGGRRMKVPADEIIHPFVTERANQTRGVPWPVSALIRLHHMQGYEEAEVIGARASAALMGFITSPAGEVQGDDVQDNQRVTDFEPGVFKYLGPGESVEMPNQGRPHGQFDTFSRAMLRGTAAGMGASYETISKDYSQSNFSSSRLSLLNERDYWRVIQTWMMAHFHQKVFEGWLSMAVLSGVINIPDYESSPDDYHDVRWRPRGWAWVDPQKEVTAARDSVLGGLTSISKVVEQDGDDVDDLFSEISRERELAKKYGLVFDTDAKNGIKPPPVAGPKAGTDEPSAGNSTGNGKASQDQPK